MSESQIVIKVDGEVLRNFRAECIRRGSTPTREMAKLMQERLASWESDNYQEHMKLHARITKAVST